MNKYLLLSLLAIALFSCKKKKEITTSIPSPVTTGPVSAYEYFPMHPGNYWVYSWFYGDTNSVTTSSGYVNDSVYVRRDTVIGGNTYYIVEDYPNNYLSGIFRDSVGYLVDVYSRIQFSTSNFTDTLRTDSLSYGANLQFAYAWKMESNVPASTPAGDFNTIQYKTSILYSTTFPPNPKFYRGNSYARQVGLVLDHTYYQANPNAVIEIKLLRYHVQ